MTLREELSREVRSIFGSQWTIRRGQTVPEAQNLKLQNDAVTIVGTVLYADLSASTKLVDDHKNWFAAGIYKAYLGCAARIIRTHHGFVTAYDGDRIMAVFIGENPNTRATKAALSINYAVHEVIQPALNGAYPGDSYRLAHTIGVDSSPLFVARTGIRGSNDLVWVGRAANHAAKLNDFPSERPLRLTPAVYDKIHESVKMKDGREMWQPELAIVHGHLFIYCSDWMREI